MREKERWLDDNWINSPQTDDFKLEIAVLMDQVQDEMIYQSADASLEEIGRKTIKNLGRLEGLASVLELFNREKEDEGNEEGGYS